MSGFSFEERTEAALPLHDLAAPRKRHRVDTDENAVVSYSRHVPPHVRVRAICGAFSSLLSLRGHVLDTQGRFNTSEFLSLAFFYNPSVVSVESGAVVLQFPDDSPANEYIRHYTRHHPCPVHGPFRCPCHIMHEVAGGVAQLLREVFCQHYPFDVVIDCERNHPHICIHTQLQSWSVSLVGLPLPPRTFGPFPLGSVASPQSIKNCWLQYGKKSKVDENACVLCGVVASAQCASCSCRMCGSCAEECGMCESKVCRGCSAADENGVTICYRCAR
ncbi:hypothetical protein ABB37_09083 [Leptomonas pyrrhocoris]|uniref:Uncharacterized protein n=1 Tax=Leptomonas pyrrhocoris TaxID=157538 RepID=A0A0N0VD69_LEPPY|nr:hypothetical protein ABB37_09083 [Leptomonas pyrrhocoris]KPA74808.1 hypothetical protein ABB37_09083 [Leptomonas pyrrhocoris]|eukprot:XP_015653247.1 hypothetical protein ABB37_09083 [Leptomonas pyrrhocoris]